MNTIKLSAIVEFYVLELLTALSSGPARGMNSQTARDLAAPKFESDLARIRTRLEKSLGRAIRDYLIVASAREARHADSCANEYIAEFKHWERVTMYKPSAVIIALQTQFNEVEWTHGGYGGFAWGGIVDCAATYYELDNLTAFIDHVLDVEHNGGSLFDKTSAAKFVGLNMNWNKRDIRDFLDFKFDADNLLFDPKLYDEYGYTLSTATMNLIARYKNIYLPKEARLPIECGIKIRAARLPSYFETPNSGAFYYEPLEWEDNESGFYLEDSNNGNSCYHCDGFVYEGDEYFSESGYAYCEDCYDEKFLQCEGGHELRQDYAIHLDHGSYCEDCISDDHELCADCNEWRDAGDSFEYDNETYCDECISNHADECEHCGILILDELNESDPPRCDECATSKVNTPFEFQYNIQMNLGTRGGIFVHDAGGYRYLQTELALDWNHPRTPQTVKVSESRRTESSVRLDTLGRYKTVKFKFGMSNMGHQTESTDPREVGELWNGESAFYDRANSSEPHNGWNGSDKWSKYCVFEIVLISENRRTI